MLHKFKLTVMMKKDPPKKKYKKTIEPIKRMKKTIEPIKRMKKTIEPIKRTIIKY